MCEVCVEKLANEFVGVSEHVSVFLCPIWIFHLHPRISVAMRTEDDGHISTWISGSCLLSYKDCALKNRLFKIVLLCRASFVTI